MVPEKVPPLGVKVGDTDVIAYPALAMGLFARPVATAMALMVSLAVTLIGVVVYCNEATVGVVPSVV